MGSFGDDENRNDDNSRNDKFNVDSRDFATQPIDSQFYPDDDLAGDVTDDFRYLMSTMPGDDNYLFGDEFETQLVNLAGETQVLDLGGETQVLDDLDCMKNIESLNEFYTEVVAVSKCEGANKTEAFCETQVLSQDDCVKIDDTDSVGPENTEDNRPTGQGSFCRGFTSIRAASVRGSGLAARECGANCDSFSEKSSLEQQECKKDNSSLSVAKNDQECLQNGYIEEPRNSNKCAAVRKLFKADKVAEVDPLEADIVNTDDNADRPENCLAGLSYANSQEPGELSQERALKVVDKFLDFNVMDLDEGFGVRVQKAEKPKVASGAKGSRELAQKKYVPKITDGECGIYDWDDTREDDGGGEFFVKKKELFFNNGGRKQRCLTEPKKPKCSDFESVAVGSNGDEKEQKCNKNKLRDSVYTDTGLISHKLRSKGESLFCGEKVPRKNLITDLNEQLNVMSENNSIEKDKNNDVPDMNDIGPDTQIAAEAMETLCFEVDLADGYGNDSDKDAHITEKATKKNQISNRSACSKERSTAKRPYHTSAGVVTRQSKQMKRFHISASNESSLSPKQLDSTVLADNRTKITGQSSENKPHLEDHLDFPVSVAHRTRKCTELNHTKTAAKSFVTREKINQVLSARARKKTAAKDKNAEIKIGSNRSSSPNIESVDNPLEKRYHQEKPHQADTQYNKRFKRSRKVAQQDADHEKDGAGSSKERDEKIDAEKSSEGALANDRLEASPPATCRTPVNKASPICMGDEYHKQTCRKNLSRMSLITEINNVVTGSPESCGLKESRKRKDITSIRVLFSQHLDEDVVKQQKKILARLGGGVATFMSDATHFVADEFVRTRNMLEAIASGKSVVTHLWLESCGQASCPIDEKNYILRDSRKEREFGFCLPTSLSRACQRPLLQGQKVLVTPNTKPGKDILANLVKAVHGLAIERVGRSVLNDKKLPDDLLILSCEEDYDVCVPFLEKGGAVYSSELLLNGIVKQKLEYERHRLFDDHVKRTRSTIWMKKKNVYLPVTKCK